MGEPTMRLNPERILVTGGAGFIGSHFIHYMLHLHSNTASRRCCPDIVEYRHDSTPPVSILNVDALTYASDEKNLLGVQNVVGYRFERVDVTDSANVDRVVRLFRPDAIVHFAAESHVDRSIETGNVFARTNFLGTQVILDAARRYDVGHFLHVSTDEVYGSRQEGSFSETDPLEPSSPYSASKAGSDLLVLAHHRTYGIPVTITRCTNNYGPNQNPEKFLAKIVLHAREGRPIPIYGSGMNIRDWLYVKDHCAALDLLLRDVGRGEVYNIAAHDERANLDVARLVLRMMGKSESLLNFVADRPGHDWRYSLDDRKLRARGWAPRMRFEDGLRHVLASAREAFA